jgi:TRAP-type C4-dicarboxylate transport system permease small subunit
MKWGLIQSSDITGINLGWLYASVPIAGVSWLLFLVEGILKEFFKIGPAKEAQ